MTKDPLLNKDQVCRCNKLVAHPKENEDVEHGGSIEGNRNSIEASK